MYATVALAGSLMAGLATASVTDATSTPGAALFQRHCAVCHGSAGAGDGAAASRFVTAPANLTDGLVKFRSTTQGAAPLRSDLERTIRNGSRGTAMVEWGSFLTDAQIESLASYVLALEGYGGEASDRRPPAVSPAGTAPAEGAALYARFGCAQCHGEDRRGAGPAAAGLVDSRGHRIPMPDVAVLPYKRGSDPLEAAKTLLYGMDGTPMAAFEGAITNEQALALARWLIESAVEERSGWLGEEHLGFMIEMHEGARGMGGHHGMGGRHGRSGRHGMGGGPRFSGPHQSATGPVWTRSVTPGRSVRTSIAGKAPAAGAEVDEER
jgi:mono/diheme cytochrome c family protein